MAWIVRRVKCVININLQIHLPDVLQQIRVGAMALTRLHHKLPELTHHQGDRTGVDNMLTERRCIFACNKGDGAHVGGDSAFGGLEERRGIGGDGQRMVTSTTTRVHAIEFGKQVPDSLGECREDLKGARRIRTFFSSYVSMSDRKKRKDNTNTHRIIKEGKQKKAYTSDALHFPHRSSNERSRAR